MSSLSDRIMSRVSIEGNGCWTWTGANDGRDGYGRILIDGKQYGVHRISYQEHVGEIPEGLVIDHLCRNRACVNPKHLEPVTVGENVRRGATGYRTVTHCKRGHDFAISGYVTRAGNKRCRLCERIRSNSQYKKLRGAAYGKYEKAGDKSPSAKLKLEQVTEIRRIRFEDKVSYQKIAVMFGVSKPTIMRIVERKTWK